MPLFTIIVVHYQGTVPHPVFLRGIDSIAKQTFRDFELLVYHDGPLLDPTVQTPVPLRCTPVRHNDFGHSLRDIGIREASGDYIVHTNADNVFYPHALDQIAKEIRRPPRDYGTRVPMRDNPEVVIYPIAMFGFMRVNGWICQAKTDAFYTILTGTPPAVGNIDCMQLVMRRDLWLAEGGWSDKHPESDGRMYQRFAEKYGHRSVGPVCGEHH
jgi:hypothetical protein